MKHWAALVTLALIPSSALIVSAADIHGTVRSATEKYATVVSDSELVPTPGDTAEIFFKLPGTSVEVSVASGQVYEITGQNIMIKIDKATATVSKDQLVRIASANPLKRSIVEPPVSPTKSQSESGSGSINFDGLSPGPVASEAFADRGIHLRSGKGKPGIYRSDPNMVMPSSHQTVLLLADERATSITIAFDNPIKRFALSRVGTRGGASIPTWTMKAFDESGKVVGSAGEKHGQPPAPKSFVVEHAGIARVEISTDNRNGAGTWATWSSLPIAEFGFDR